MTELRLDWCSYDAAKYACEHWHYSHCVPNQKTVKIGVWEDGVFVGAILFGDGANNRMFEPYGLTYTQGCELVRVALRNHATPVSRLIRIALQMMRRLCPGIRLVISFADPEHGHHGGIYQSAGWLYTGMSSSADEYLVNGVRMHGRALRSTRSTHRRGGVEASNVMQWAVKVLDPNIRSVPGSSKHRYLLALDDAMQRQIKPLRKPYPRRPRLDSEAPTLQVGDEGAAMRPTGSIGRKAVRDGKAVEVHA